MTTPEIKGSFVTCRTSQEVELRGNLLRVTRHVAIFEVYSPGTVVHASEVLSDFRILTDDRIIYAGRAVVRSVVNTGAVSVCEATLEEGWYDIDWTSCGMDGSKLRQDVEALIGNWHIVYKVLAEYKLIVADMQNFFYDLRLWLEQVELGIRSSPSADRVALEQRVIHDLQEPVVASISHFFERFEAIAEGIEPDLLPMHRAYMKRQLHPLLLCSPFAYRTYTKPLGYAGDYEMVNMIARDRYEGGSVYAKLINCWFIHQPPAEAHRNRIDYLISRLVEESARTEAAGRPLRVFNLACGPALEVQRFLAQQVSDRAQFTLVDFNDETLQHTTTRLAEAKSKYHRRTQLEVIKQSVQGLLKDSGKIVQRGSSRQYDFVYCAGLFDYLSDPVCRRLMSVLYSWLAPGGLLLATNVDPHNPLRNGMEHLLDWNLVYRTAAQAQLLKPPELTASMEVRADVTGVNLMMEIRRPHDA